MSDKEKRIKPKYETPTVVPLGEMAKGSGACGTGSNVVAPACSPGGADSAPIDCAPGATATRDCTMGGTAQRACTAGPTNIGGTCSAGGSANPTCTGGAAPGSGCGPGGNQ
jgi:hypothetical protein